jgi:CheY-like chemotaxis protein
MIREIPEMTIWTVDNDRYNVMLILELLREAGFQSVAGFHSGEELLDSIRDTQPDLILSDIMMPGMSGYELCQALKLNPLTSSIPVIMITAATMHGSEPLRKSFEAGAIDFIPKPIDDTELIMRVRSALRLEKQRQELEFALMEVRKLQGMLPICSYCKKIRTDHHYWEEIEVYISEHSEASFSHGVCPECYKKHILPQFEEMRRLKAMEEAQGDPPDADPQGH